MLIYLLDLLMAGSAVLAGIWGGSTALTVAAVYALADSLEREFSRRIRSRLRDALASLCVAVFFFASGSYLLTAGLLVVQEGGYGRPEAWVATVAVLVALTKRMTSRESLAPVGVYVVVALGIAVSYWAPWQDALLAIGISVIILYHSGEMALSALEELWYSEGISRSGKEG